MRRCIIGVLSFFIVEEDSAVYNILWMFPRPVMDDMEYGRTLEFFEGLLRKGSSCRLEDEYPLVFGPERKSQLLVLQQQHQIQAGLGYLIREIEVEPDLYIRAMFIGSVVTDPEFRNRGLQRSLFHAAEEAAERAQVDLVVLWSNQLEFYQKMGFSLAGLQATWSATTTMPIPAAGFRVEVRPSEEVPLRREWYEAFSRKRYRVHRTLEEMSALWQIPQMKIAATDSAYALYGKGEDFQHIIHEWAGPADEVLSCIQAIRKLDPHLRILSPGVLHTDEEREVVLGLEQAGFESRLEYLGLFKVLSNRLELSGLSPEDLRYPFFIWGLDSI